MKTLWEIWDENSKEFPFYAYMLTRTYAPTKHEIVGMTSDGKFVGVYQFPGRPEIAFVASEDKPIWQKEEPKDES